MEPAHAIDARRLHNRATRDWRGDGGGLPVRSIATSGDRPPGGISGRPGRQRPFEPDGDGVRAGRPAVRHAAGRSTARYQERRLLPTPLLHADRNSAGERGLLGSPSTPTSRSINSSTFTTRHDAGGAQPNSRFKANGDVVDASAGELVLLDFDNLSSATNHNGGALHLASTANSTPHTATTRMEAMRKP